LGKDTASPKGAVAAKKENDGKNPHGGQKGKRSLLEKGKVLHKEKIIQAGRGGDYPINDDRN